MSAPAQATPAVRPYFVPVGIDFRSLPRDIQIAFQEIVEPAYREMVVGGMTGLERSAGATFVFLLAQEVLEQCALGREMDFQQTQDASQLEDRYKMLQRHLRLIASKQQAANFVMRLKCIRAKYGSLGTPPEFAT